MARRRQVGGAAAPPTDGDSSGHPDEDRLDPEPDPESVARTICLRLLTMRSRSRAELSEALRTRNVPDDASERVLGRLAAVGLVDDHAYAVNFVQAKRSERGFAARELSRQLRGKGIDDEIIMAAISELDDNAEHATARRLAERKVKGMSGLEPNVQIRRLAGMLARKGYPPGICFQVVREVVGAAAADQLGDDLSVL